MKDVQKELLAISTALSSLVKQVEKITEVLEAEDGGAAAPVKKAKATKKAAARKTKATAKKRAAKKQAPTASEEPAPEAALSGETMLDSIFGMISRSRNGITVERLKKRSGLEARQVSNALYKLTKKGKIETISRGLYVKKKS